MRRKRSSPDRLKFHIESLEPRYLLAADWGDAPSPYPTRLLDAGPKHTIANIASPVAYLGADVDTEANGVPGGNEVEDDGVLFTPLRVGGAGAAVAVTVTNAPTGAFVDAWIDFNADGSWEGPWEQIANRRAVSQGTNVIVFDVPSWAADGDTWARFRITSSSTVRLGIGAATTDGPGAAAIDGEVEDYRVTIARPNETNGTFGAQQTITTNSFYADGANSLFAADVDDDGDIDLVSTSAVQANINDSSWSSRVSLHRNDGLGNFTPERIEQLTGGASLRSIVADDIDGDGDFDLVVGDFIGDRVLWYENMDGDFDADDRHTIATGLDGVWHVRTADIDRDGDIDVVSTVTHEDRIVWHENVNLGFTTRTVTANYDMDGNPNNASNGDLNGPIALALVDVNTDGRIDIVTAGAIDDQVVWFPNDGTPTGPWGNGLGQPMTIKAVDTLQGFPESLSVVAVNLNGTDNDNNGFLDIDVAVAQFPNESNAINDRQEEIRWYDWNSSPASTQNWGTPTDISHATDPIAGPETIVAGDLDGDGDYDIVSASQLDDRIAWFENNGSGVFSALKNVNIPDSDTNSTNGTNGNANLPKSVVIADLDGDGDLDIASASYNDDKIAWYENIGNETSLLGDYDNNRQVDGLDYLVWKVFFGTTYDQADGNGNGVVDAADYTIWRDNLGASAPAAVGVADETPISNSAAMFLGTELADERLGRGGRESFSFGGPLNQGTIAAQTTPDPLISPSITSAARSLTEPQPPTEEEAAHDAAITEWLSDPLAIRWDRLA